VSDELKSVVDLCRDEGIELVGDEGHPYCCGERMQTKSGVFGTDYARCRSCGKTVGNLASPHINGHGFMTDEWLEEHGPRTWARLDDANVED
jgi:hypothetical protein